MAFPPESFKKTKHHKLFSEFTWTYVNSFEIQISTKQLLFAQLDLNLKLNLNKIINFIL